MVAANRSALGSLHRVPLSRLAPLLTHTGDVKATISPRSVLSYVKVYPHRCWAWHNYKRV